MYIHAVPEKCPIYPESPSLGEEFFQQLEKRKARNGCIMLEDKLQDNWSPCKWETQSGEEVKGTIVNGFEKCGAFNKVIEPIHFCGPSPFDNSAIADEEEKKE